VTLVEVNSSELKVLLKEENWITRALVVLNSLSVVLDLRRSLLKEGRG